jgi:hypothetical protein
MLRDMDKRAWRLRVGDTVALRAVPPREFNPGVVETFKHPDVMVGDWGLVVEYTQHDDGDETIRVEFEYATVCLYPQQVEPVMEVDGTWH